VPHVFSQNSSFRHQTKKVKNPQDKPIPAAGPNATFAPPAELSEFSKRVWSLLVPARARSTSRLLLLRRALLAHDEAERCDEVLRRDGLLSKALGGKMAHLHPLAKHRDEQRKAFDAAWAKLSLEHTHLDQVIDGHWEGKPGTGLPTT
jgi:hypothetical protein